MAVSYLVSLNRIDKNYVHHKLDEIMISHEKTKLPFLGADDAMLKNIET